MLVFKTEGKPEYPEKNLPEQSRKSTTNSTHMTQSWNETWATLVGGDCSDHCNTYCSPASSSAVCLVWFMPVRTNLTKVKPRLFITSAHVINKSVNNYTVIFRNALTWGISNYLQSPQNSDGNSPLKPTCAYGEFPPEKELTFPLLQ